MRSNSGTERKKLFDVGIGAESHYALDAGPIIPAAIEQHDFTAGREVRDIALEIPLGALTLVRRRQRGDATDPRIEALGDTA